MEGTWGWKVPLGVNSSPCPRPISITQDILDKNCDYLDIGPSLDLTWVIIVFICIIFERKLALFWC